MKILNIIGIAAMAVGAVKILCLSISLFKSNMSLLSRLSESASQQFYISLTWFAVGLVLAALSEIKPRGD